MLWRCGVFASRALCKPLGDLMPAMDIPAPVGGWNARDALANMPPTDAVKLVNFIPRGSYVQSRGGYGVHA